MKKTYFFCLACLLAAVIVTVSGCGKGAGKISGGGATLTASNQVSGISGSGKSTGAGQSAKSDSSIQGSAADIAKMLSSIQSDTAAINTDGDTTSGSTDSTINEINSALNSDDDDISGLN